MLGIAWGLVTVVLLLTYGQSLGKEVLNALHGHRQQRHHDLGRPDHHAGRRQRAGQRSSFEYADLEAVRDDVPFVKRSQRRNRRHLAFKFGTESSICRSRPSRCPTAEMRTLKSSNRAATSRPADFTEHRDVAIFGPNAARKLFSGLPPVGQSVSINGHSFEVIGVLQNKIQDSYNNGPDNEKVFIPMPMMRDLKNQRDPDSIVFAPLDSSLHLQALSLPSAPCSPSATTSIPPMKRPSPAWDTIEDSAQIMQFSTALAGRSSASSAP